MNQVLSYDRLVYFGLIFEQSGLASAKKAEKPQKPAIMFGERKYKESEVNSFKKNFSSKYDISPTKIRKAGYEEMKELERQEEIAASASLNTHIHTEDIMSSNRINLSLAAKGV